MGPIIETKLTEKSAKFRTMGELHLLFLKVGKDMFVILKWRICVSLL